MSDFTAIGQLVTEARNLLDSIKGGAIRTMQTQFDALKKQFSDKLTAVDSQLLSFVNQQKAIVSGIFTDPDNRYQKIAPVSLKINGDKDKFYPVVFGSSDTNRIVKVFIGRQIHQDETWSGAMYAGFRAASFSWGGRAGTMVMEVLKTVTREGYTSNEVFSDGFVGDYKSSNYHPDGVVVWLRGGYTYDFWVDGAPLNSVIETNDKTAQSSNNNAVVYLNGYEKTYGDIYQKLDVLTARNTTRVPKFMNYEEA